jgi:hypothetical protein
MSRESIATTRDARVTIFASSSADAAPTRTAISIAAPTSAASPRAIA